MTDLDRELRTYERERAGLLAHEGKFALIHGDDVAGVYATYADAMTAAYARFGLDDRFLVHEIHAVDPVEFIPFLEFGCRS